MFLFTNDPRIDTTMVNNSISIRDNLFFFCCDNLDLNVHLNKIFFAVNDNEILSVVCSFTYYSSCNLYTDSTGIITYLFQFCTNTYSTILL